MWSRPSPGCGRRAKAWCRAVLLLPTLSGSTGYQRNENLRGGGRSFTLPDGTVVDTGGGGSNSFTVGLSASYQVGLFGELRRTVEATRATYESAGFTYAATLLTVESELARNYVLARAYQAQLANARASLALQDDNLEIAGFRVRAGLVSSLDAEQARGSGRRPPRPSRRWSSNTTPPSRAWAC
jgi:outer membrane protein TolC